LGFRCGFSGGDSGETGTITYGYNLDSVLTSKTDNRGMTVTYTPEFLHRLSQKTYSDGETTKNFTYDTCALGGSYCIGRRTSMTDASGSTSWAYDSMGRILKEQQTIGTLESFARYSSSPPRAMSLNRGYGRKPLQLLASPVPQERGAGPDAAVLLLATDPERPVHVNDDLLRASYGFTAAEVEVANGLLTGYSLEEIAALRRVSIGTVRQQVKAILGKSGTSRQSDLVRLLLNLPGVR
jgi:DNA-binding CsgD family transcriptional regulator